MWEVNWAFDEMKYCLCIIKSYFAHHDKVTGMKRIDHYCSSTPESRAGSGNLQSQC